MQKSIPHHNSALSILLQGQIYVNYFFQFLYKKEFARRLVSYKSKKETLHERLYAAQASPSFFLLCVFLFLQILPDIPLGKLQPLHKLLMVRLYKFKVAIFALLLQLQRKLAGAYRTDQTGIAL